MQGVGCTVAPHKRVKSAAVLQGQKSATANPEPLNPNPSSLIPESEPRTPDPYILTPTPEPLHPNPYIRTPNRCHPILVAFVWELTKETIDLPLGCLQGGVGSHTQEQEHCANRGGHAYFAEIYSGSEAGSYLRLIDFFISQL